MDNNSNDMNRLLQELANQKKEDRKYLLKIEIAKATDRSVKQALQEILDDIEKKEKKSRMVFLIVIAILIGAILFVIGNIDFSKKENPKPLANEVSSSTIESTNPSFQKVIETKESRKKEISLTNAQVKEWVIAVWDMRHQHYPDIKNIRMNIRSDDKDKLVYIDVLPPIDKEVDKYSVFRINAKGELEESGYYNQNGGINNWVIVSREFMDTSEVDVKPEIIVERKKEDSSPQHNISSNEAITWVQDYLKSQGTEPLDFEDVTFDTQQSSEGLTEVMMYTWNPAHTAKTFFAVYRVNAEGKLEEGSIYGHDDWHVVSDEFKK